MCCYLQEEDRKIDELWENVYFDDEPMRSWILRFNGSFDDRIRKCKQEIKQSLREYQADPRKSFLTRLMTNDPPLAGYEYGILVNYCKIT